MQLSRNTRVTPDASWISHARLAQVTDEQRRRFLPAVPEFVIEILSPSDSRRQEGVDLAWLIDPPKKSVYVFRKGQAEPERIVDANSIQGEGPLATFKLNLQPIWKGRA
jgi:Uma2 family endonuclease